MMVAWRTFKFFIIQLSFSSPSGAVFGALGSEDDVNSELLYWSFNVALFEIHAFVFGRGCKSQRMSTSNKIFFFFSYFPKQLFRSLLSEGVNETELTLLLY